MSRRLDPYLLLVLLLSAFSIAPLLQPGYFWEAHDARHSVYFLFEFDRGLTGNAYGLYPRWQPDFAFGYGYPFFNIYGPLATMAGEALHLLGWGFVDAVKIVFGLSFLLSGATMYAFVSRVLGQSRPGARGERGRVAGLVAGVAYMTIPYRLVDVYVRAALAESVAYVFVPLVLWAAWAAIHRPRLANVLGLAAAYAGLMLASPLVTLLFSLILAFFLGLLAVGRVADAQPWRSLTRESVPAWLGHAAHVLAPPAAGLLLGVGLSAFFALPAMVENRFVRVDQWYGGRYAWGGDFVEFYQLWSPSWGLGVSVPGPDDDVSFQLGVVPAVLSLFSLVALVRRRRTAPEPAAGRLPTSVRRLGVFFVVLTAVTVWLMLAASAPVWQVLPLARLVQFPWRLLSVTTVGLAFLCGLAARELRPTGSGGLGTWPLQPVAVALAALLVLGSLPYMQAKMSERPVSLAGLMQFQQSSDEMTGSTAWVAEIPRWSPLADYFIAGEPLTSKINYDYLYRQAGRVRAETIELHTDAELIAYEASRPALVTFNTFYYPGWRAYLLDPSGRPAEELPVATRGKLGLMTVGVPAGEGRVLLRFEDTPIRKLATATTLASLALVAVSIVGRWAARRLAARRARGLRLERA